MGHKQRAGQANCPKTNIRVGITFGGQVNLGKGNISEAVNFAKKAFQETAKIEAIDIIAPIGANLVNSYKLNTDFSNAIDIGSKVIRIFEKQIENPNSLDGPFVYALSYTPTTGIVKPI